MVCLYFSLCQLLTLTVILLLSLLTLLLIVVLFLHVYIRHSSSLVTRRRSSLIVARRRSSLVVARSLSTHHLTLSLMRAHTLSLSYLSTLPLLLIAIVAHGIFVHRPPPPSISSLVSLHLTLFLIAVPYSSLHT